MEGTLAAACMQGCAAGQAAVADLVQWVQWLREKSLVHEGTGASAAHARRDRSDAFHARRREAHQLHFAAQRLHRQ